MRANSADPRWRGRLRSTGKSPAIAPLSIITMRSASATASATSCVTRIEVNPLREPHLLDEALHFDAGQRIERAERFVERKQARRAHERARERDTLLLPA